MDVIVFNAIADIVMTANNSDHLLYKGVITCGFKTRCITDNYQYCCLFGVSQDALNRAFI